MNTFEIVFSSVAGTLIVAAVIIGALYWSALGDVAKIESCRRRPD
jgi:hypothetical protein